MISRRARAAVVGLAALTLVAGVGWALVRAVDWLGRQPGYTLAFRDIELDPPPPPWIRPGRLGLLEQVRRLGGFPETVSLLDLDGGRPPLDPTSPGESPAPAGAVSDLGRLRLDFQRCPWVRRVGRIERPFRRLIVHLDYREPVARIDLEATTILLDGDGVVLPEAEVIPTGPPLIPILGLGAPLEARHGQALKAPDGAAGDGSTHLPAAAAALAAAARRRTQGPSPLSFPVRSVVLSRAAGRRILWLVIGDGVRVHWGPVLEPGSIAELPDQAKWALLEDWARRSGGARLADREVEWLVFAHGRVEVRRDESLRHP